MPHADWEMPLPRQFLIGCVFHLLRYGEGEKGLRNPFFICFSSRLGEWLGLKGHTWLWPTPGMFVAHCSWSLGLEKVLLHVLAGVSAALWESSSTEKMRGGGSMLSKHIPIYANFRLA